MSTDALPLTQPISTRRDTCRACGAPHLDSVLDLGNQFLPRWVADRDETLPKAPLHLVRCRYCDLLQLADTVDPDLLYRQFWYRTGINATMRAAMEDLIADVMRFRRQSLKMVDYPKVVTRNRWLDIGANDGYLLSKLPETFWKAACEPALNFKAELEEQADKVILDYFSLGATGGQLFDVITSAAMFYDLDNPHEFLSDIHDSLYENGIWVNQLADAPTMFKQNAFDAICHEHVAYYDLHVLKTLYEQHHLKIVSISYNDVNGGSARIIAMRDEDVSDGYMLADHPRCGESACREFAGRVRRWKREFSELVRHLGPNLWCYGASTKGSTLMQYLDCTDQFVAMADRNPQKYGLQMAGIWLPIEDEKALRLARPRAALVLPWAFREEFVKRERDLMANGTALLMPLPNPEVVL